MTMTLKETMRKPILIALCFLSLLSCGPSGSYKGEDVRISRLLERAVEVGDRYLDESELLDNVAIADGAEAALKLREELGHREKYELFRSCLEDYECTLRQIPDTLEQRRIRTRMKPYLDHIATIQDQIIP